MRAGWLVTLLLLFAPTVEAAVSITSVWSRATPPATTVGVVYAELISDKDDSLIAIEAGGLAERVEVHVSSNDGGTMKMRPVTSVALPAGQRVRFQPGGMHVMLIGLRKPLVAGASIPITFKFRDAAAVHVEAKIIGPGEREPLSR